MEKSALCEFCKEEFIKTRPWHKFCSDQCRMANYKKRHSSDDKYKTLENRINKLEQQLGIPK